MPLARSISACAAAVSMLIATTAYCQPTEASITKEIQGLRAVPDPQRPAATTKIAEEIRTLAAGQSKVKLADALTHLSTEGDPGRDTLQAVADTLAESVRETPKISATTRKTLKINRIVGAGRGKCPMRLPSKDLEFPGKD